MLTAEENELLTRTGPGTPMGSLIRRYWLPVLLSREVADPDGAPVAVEVLGERLVAFRDTAGAVGLLEERCAHRSASLVYGRNEAYGIRCIFHGWKYDGMGRCVDTPTEPEDSKVKQSVRLPAYPNREAGGVVWAYLGPPEREPPFPEYSWLRLPATQCQAYKVRQDCNYAQSLERDVDPAHIPIAHRRLTDGQVRAGVRLADLDRRETVPRVEVQETAYGFRYAAVRPRDETQEHVRMTSYVMPSCLILGPAVGANTTAQVVVPRDDGSNWQFLFRFNNEEPVDIAEYTATRGLDRLDAGYRKLRDMPNRYDQDREAMRLRSFTGIEGVIIEDHALAEIQGMVVDRTRERVGATDTAVVALRRHLLAAAQALAAGGDLPGVQASIPFARIAGADFVQPAGARWQETCPLAEGLSVVSRAARRKTG
ncbi:MAG: Rieske 2Fe-2S domain-containing protein [Chloroflexi bacterium]|nr:Rieske 2Fe-2S domain-containing protein [Chloroflexota bacterium]